MQNPIHITEDDAVCRDYTTPHLSLMEMFSSTIISQVSQKYGVTYSHDCDRAKQQETGDNYDYTTIQQNFPKSSLVLDDGSVPEEEVVDLCKGCIAEHNKLMNAPKADPNDTNPNYFHRESTHHCILYPGVERSVVNAEGEVDLAALSEQRRIEQHTAFNKVLPTITDRIQLSAAEHKLATNDQVLAKSLEIEETDGAVILLEASSKHMPLQQYGQPIPSSVKTVEILLGPKCILSDECSNHGLAIQSYFESYYGEARVSVEVVMSTDASYSRAVRAKYLVCPPCTTACLIPALAKEDGTSAVVAESEECPKTFHYFDFVSDSDPKLHVVQLAKTGTTTDTAEAKALLPTGASARVVGADTPEGEIGITSTNLEDGLAAFGYGEEYSAESTGDGQSGCTENRGRLGSWEQDYQYADLASHKNSALRGSSIEDVIEEIDAGLRSRSTNFEDSLTLPGQGRAGGPSLVEGFDGDGELGITGVGGATDDSTDESSGWVDGGEPGCELTLMSLKGLCEVVNVMKLGVLQFVGDEYTEEMVKIFWSYIGLPDPDNAGKVTPTETDPAIFRRTAHCPFEQISFDLVFTPNEELVHTLEPKSGPVEPIKEIQYVPVPAPGPAVTQPLHPNGSGGSFLGLGGGGGGWTGGVGCWIGNCAPQPTPMVNVAGTCWSNPYGNGCGCNTCAMHRAAAPVVPPPPPPMMQTACGCVPFQQQYQHYQGAVLPQQPGMYQPNQYVAPTYNRQFVVAGLNPNVPYNQYVNNVDSFGQGITNYVDQNDIVIMRTGVSPLGQYGNRRRTKATNIMSSAELSRANQYLHKSINEYRRQAKQMDYVNYDPSKSGLPYVHILDVTHMTETHPLADPRARARKVEQAPNLFEHWSHLLYSNMRDMAAAEVAKQSPEFQIHAKTAPEGSPYHNSVREFTGN